MRTVVYSIVLASLLVVALFAFAPTPVTAASQEETMKSTGSAATQQPAEMQPKADIERKTDVQPKAGIQPKTDIRSKTDAELKAEEMKAKEFKARTQTPAAGELKTEKPFGDVKTDVSDQAPVSRERKFSAPAETSQRMEKERTDVPAQPRVTVPGEKREHLMKQPQVGVSGSAQTGVIQQGAPATARQQSAVQMNQPAAAGGVEALVIGVDRPENCLRIRSGPAGSTQVTGCVAKGDKLVLTGVFSNDKRWAQLDNGGWVFISQIKSDILPRQAATSRRQSRDVEMYDYDYEPWEVTAGAGSSRRRTFSPYDTSYGSFEPYDESWEVPARAGAYRVGPYDYSYRGAAYAPLPGFSAPYGTGYYFRGPGIGFGTGVVAPPLGFGLGFGFR